MKRKSFSIAGSMPIRERAGLSACGRRNAIGFDSPAGPVDADHAREQGRAQRGPWSAKNEND